MAEIRIDRSDEGDTARLALGGELDLSTAGDVEEAVRSIEDAGPSVIVLDLSGLAFMDSTGLRLVLSADARARDDGRRLAIVPGPDPVHRVFRIALLEERLDFVAPDWVPDAEAP